MAQCNSSRVGELLAEMRQTEVWNLWWEMVRGLRVRAYHELAEAESWNDTLQVKGAIRTLEALMDFPELLEDMEKQKKEEEEVLNNGR
jgi:hypothetical protein